MEKKISGYRDLRGWQSGYELTLELYRLTKKFPKRKYLAWSVRCGELHRPYRQISLKDMNAITEKNIFSFCI